MNKSLEFIRYSEVDEEIYQWMEKIVEENWKKADSESVRIKIQKKALHTNKVVETIRTIVDKEKEAKFDMKMATIAALVHDVGRFPQALMDDFSDVRTGIDHGDLGAKLYKEKGFQLSGVDENEIEETIKWHNKIAYNGNSNYAKLARDADKVTILLERHFLEDPGLKGGTINPLVWEAVINNRLVSKKDAVSSADWIILRIMLLWDFNFATSKEMIRNSEIPKELIEKLKSVGVEKEKEEKLKIKLLSY